MKNRYRLNFSLVAIIFLSGFLRFYSYSSRWALAYDQAWFGVIGRYAFEHLKLPFLGPFASGGPFQTGGEWFWIVMLGTALNPFSVISPWIFITLISIFQVYLLYLLGKEFIDKKAGLLAALFCAVSVSQVLQATNLTSQMTASVCASLLLLGIIKYLKVKRLRYLFIAGFGVGLSSAIHLQGVLLLIPLVVFIGVTKSIKPKQLFLVFVGLLVPWLPVLLVDLQNHFYNTINMLSYFSHPQSQVPYEVLGRRWLTFILVYLPTSWGRILGGSVISGYIELFLVGFSAVVALVTKKIEKKWLILLLGTAVMTIVLRYIRTPLYENYTTFIHPFVILLIVWATRKLIEKNRIIGFIFIACVVLFSILAIRQEVRSSTNMTAIETARYVTFLKEKYPGTKFAIYDYQYKTSGKSLALVLYLQSEGLIDDRGTKIGMAIASSGAQMKLYPHKAVFGEIGAYQLLDLSASTSASLGKAEWAFINPSVIYSSVEDWYKKK